MNLIQDMDIDNKRVILRCDFNVPIKDNKILDDYKIRESLQTIKYIMDHNSSVIILSHLGKIKKEEDKLKNSLEIVAIRLQELLSSNVKFSKQTRSTALDELVNTLKPRDVLLL